MVLFEQGRVEQKTSREVPSNLNSIVTIINMQECIWDAGIQEHMWALRK